MGPVESLEIEIISAFSMSERESSASSPMSSGPAAGAGGVESMNTVPGYRGLVPTLEDGDGEQVSMTKDSDGGRVSMTKDSDSGLVSPVEDGNGRLVSPVEDGDGRLVSPVEDGDGGQGLAELLSVLWLDTSPKTSSPSKLRVRSVT